MVCLVTGSSRGLGKSIALAFGAKNYRVAVHYRKDRDGALMTASGIKDSMVIQGDVRDGMAVKSFMKKVIREWGRVDVVVNNAGITRESLLITTSEETFSDVLNTNLKGSFAVTQEAGKYMMKQSAGHIINISSYAGVKGKAGLAAYASSKAALTALSRTAAYELGRYNIMVNTVLPGYMMTDMGLASHKSAQEQALNESIVKSYSDPEHIASFICYLVNTTGITGQVFNLDGRII